MMVAVVFPSLQQYFSDGFDCRTCGGTGCGTPRCLIPRTHLDELPPPLLSGSDYGPHAVAEPHGTDQDAATEESPRAAHVEGVGARRPRSQSGSGPFGTVPDTVGGLVTVKRQQLRCLTGNLSSFT